MATAVDLKELTNILECAVCLDTVRTPKTLVCNHSYCKRCLDGLLQFRPSGSALIKCPKSCTETTKLSNTQTTNDLGVDYMLKSIADVVIARDNQQDAGQENIKCDSVDCARDVIAYCVMCDSLMCHSCRVKHKICEQINPFVHVSFDAIDKQLNVLCTTHKTESNYICGNDDFICLYCLHRQHKGHAYVILENEAAQLRNMLSKAIEHMEMFTQSIDIKLNEAETDICIAKENLEKVLKSRKAKCISDYVAYLNKEEERIITEFNAAATSHVAEFRIDDPCENYKKFLSKEGIQIVLQRGPIMNMIPKERMNIEEVTVTLSEHSFNNINPLGNMNITFGKITPIDEAEKTFKNKLSTEGALEVVSVKLLEDIQNLIQEALKYKFSKFGDGATNDDNKGEVLNECPRRYEDRGMDYIDDLIVEKKNEELFTLLREHPRIFYGTYDSRHNRPIHKAAQHNNIDFLKELLRYDKSMINFKNEYTSNALHVSAAIPSSFDCFKWLAHTYPNMLDEKNVHGCTPLHIAAAHNCIEAVKVLRNKGVDVSATENRGYTPLDCATLAGNEDIVALLQ